MAELNPLVTGDIPYPQYSVTTTQSIEPGVTIIKGRLYTKNAAGNLIISGIDLTNGFYQAASTPTINVPAIDGDEVQVLGPRTRMLFLNLVGGIVEGEHVDAVPDTDQVVGTSISTDTDYVGRVFEIYTKDSNGDKKLVSEIGDLLIVETVGP